MLCSSWAVGLYNAQAVYGVRTRRSVRIAFKLQCASYESTSGRLAMTREPPMPVWVKTATILREMAGKAHPTNQRVVALEVQRHRVGRQADLIGMSKQWSTASPQHFLLFLLHDRCKAAMLVPHRTLRPPRAGRSEAFSPFDRSLTDLALTKPNDAPESRRRRFAQRSLHRRRVRQAPFESVVGPGDAPPVVLLYVSIDAKRSLAEHSNGSWSGYGYPASGLPALHVLAPASRHVRRCSHPRMAPSAVAWITPFAYLDSLIASHRIAHIIAYLCLHSISYSGICSL